MLFTGPFPCRNGEKIPSTSVCNAFDDCSVGEDEVNCTTTEYVESGIIEKKTSSLVPFFEAGEILVLVLQQPV